MICVLPDVLPMCDLCVPCVTKLCCVHAMHTINLGHVSDGTEFSAALQVFVVPPWWAAIRHQAMSPEFFVNTF